VLVHWSVDRVKAGSRGALPALIIDGQDFGTIVHVEMTDGAVSRETRPLDAQGKPLPKTLKERRAILESRRRLQVVNEFREKVLGKSKPPPFDVVIGLVSVFGTSVARTRVNKADWKKYTTKHTGLATHLWSEVVQVLRQRLILQGTLDSVPPLWADLCTLTDTLQISLESLVRAATKDLPEPKSWAKEKHPKGGQAK